MTVPAFSFLVEAASLPPSGGTYELKANDDECRAIAAELGIDAVTRLIATMTVARAAGGFVILSGHFEADVVQACVVTLQPLPARLSGPIARRFAPEGAESPEGGWVDLEREDEVDTLSEGRIDLGHVLIEEVVLALDPYPRAPGAQFNPAAAHLEAGAGPFAALARLKERSARSPRGAKGRRR